MIRTISANPFAIASLFFNGMVSREGIEPPTY